MILVFMLGSMRAAEAGTIIAFGNVDALTNVSQLNGVEGTATFDGGNASQPIPLNFYSDSGMTFQAGGTLSNFLSGVTTGTVGTVLNPTFATSSEYYPGNPFNFPNPPAGGGTADSNFLASAVVAKFDVPVTQFGLTAGSANQDNFFLTAWDASGNMIGEVEWTGIQEAAFVGIDSKGVPIAMISYGNHDLFHGDDFSEGGSPTFSDTWIWASGNQVSAAPEPSTLTLVVIGAFSLVGYGWRRRRQCA